jgi:hypothetical protein
LVDLKERESDLELEYGLEQDNGKWIMDVEPTATITTTKIQLEYSKDLEEGEHLFHSYMWVKGTPLHFIVHNERGKNLISIEVIKRMNFLTKKHLQPYTLSWLIQG